MKIQCKAKVGSVTHGEGVRVRVQAAEAGQGLDSAQVYFSSAAADAPRPGQAVLITIEWEAPAGG